MAVSEHKFWRKKRGIGEDLLGIYYKHSLLESARQQTGYPTFERIKGTRPFSQRQNARREQVQEGRKCPGPPSNRFKTPPVEARAGGDVAPFELWTASNYLGREGGGVCTP